MAEQPGESKRDESDKNNTNSSKANLAAASGREAVGPRE